MKYVKISKEHYNNISKKLDQKQTDFFGINKMSTICSSGNEYNILELDSPEEKQSLMEMWQLRS